MTVEEALAAIEPLLEQGRLNTIQEAVFRQSWDGQSYMDIAASAGYDAGYVKDVGSKLWQQLSTVLGEKVTKQNMRGVLGRSGTGARGQRIGTGEQGTGEAPDALTVPARTIVHNLPVRDFSALIGRDREMTQLLDLLSEACPTHCISIEGIGGMGKTTLALAAAYQCLQASQAADPTATLPTFEALIFASAKQQRLTPHGILPRLKPERSLRDLFRAIALTLRRPDLVLAAFEVQLEQIQITLAAQRTLLLVDNLETVEDYEDVLAFLYDLPSVVKVVMTSRQQSPFVSLTLEPLRSPDGMRLIQHQADTKRVSLTPAETQVLYQQTHGIPAAIVYAVGQLAAGYPLQTLSSRLLQAESHYAHFYFESSLMPLRGQRSHQLLMALALFPQPAVMEAIATVADSPDTTHTIDQLALLQQLSLVSQQQGRYTMLALTREYAIAELAAHPDFEQAARERWVHWCLAFTQQHGGKDWKEWHDYEPLEQEWETLQDAIEWCIAQNRYEDVRQFWQQVNCYTHVQGYRGNRLSYWDTRLDWADWLIAAAEQRQHWSTALETMLAQAWTLTLMGQPQHLERADALYRTAWERRQHSDDLFQLEFAIHIAVLRIQQQSFTEAMAWLDHAHRLLETIPLDAVTARRSRLQCLYYQGEICYKTDAYDQAKQLFHQVLEQAQALAWQRAIFLAKNWLADIAIRQAQFQQAQDLLEEGLHVAEANHDECRAAFCKRSLARLEHDRGNGAIAYRWAEAAKQSFERLGMVLEVRETIALLQSLA